MGGMPLIHDKRIIMADWQFSVHQLYVGVQSTPLIGSTEITRWSPLHQ